MMRKCFVFILLLFTGVFLISCSDDHKHETYEKTIGACLSQTTVTPYGVHLRQSLEELCESQNWKFVCLDAERDAAKQQTQAEAMAEMDIDLFLFWPTERSAGVAICKTFYEKGIPIVIMNGDIAEEGYPYTTAFVGPDQYMMAHDIGEYLVKTTPDGGNAVMINGGIASTQFLLRQQGFEDAIAGSGIKLLQVEFSESDRANAQNLMANYLSLYNDIDIVYCASDNLALGAIKAIDAAGREGLRIVSIDGMKEAFDYIREGKIELTVRQTPYDTALKFIETAQTIFSGKELPERNCFNDYVLITAENVDDYEPSY